MAEERKFENTPSWALAAVCTIFVVAGVLIIHCIEQIKRRLKKAKRKPLVQALHEIKEELMQLGFISLLLVIFQNNVEHICIKDDVMDQWNPGPSNSTEEGSTSTLTSSRRLMIMTGLLPSEQWLRSFKDGRPIFRGRNLEEANSFCIHGYSSLASTETLHQLHLYLFILACVHIAYCLMGMAISVLHMRRMKDWEVLAQRRARGIDADAETPRATERIRSFVQHHMSNPLSRNLYSVWIVCFFRQFTAGVTKSDYLTLRHGFVSSHGLGAMYDFHGYLQRSLEEKFPKIVGISPFLWGVFLSCMLFHTNSTNVYFWVSFIPAIVLLAVGTKLQHVMASLALNCAGIGHHGRYGNSPLGPRDNLFWFKKPELVLFLIDYILFQNAVEMTTFISYFWFNFDSRHVSRRPYTVTRVVLSVSVFLMCSYHILPLYSVVIQMGSHASPAIFRHHVREKIRRWRKHAKRRARAKNVLRLRKSSMSSNVPRRSSVIVEVQEISITEQTSLDLPKANVKERHAVELHKVSINEASENLNELILQLAKKERRFDSGNLRNGGSFSGSSKHP